MNTQLEAGTLYEKWISFTETRSVLECEFYKLDSSKPEELLGKFSKERLVSFGEHASGSLFCFYSLDKQSTDNAPVAWLDSEGSPCVVISKNLRDFLSLLPFGSGFIYTVAAAIDSNYGANNLQEIILAKFQDDPQLLLADAKNRFIEVSTFIEWLASESIEVNSNPVQAILDAHLSQPDLIDWIVKNLT